MKHIFYILCTALCLTNCTCYHSPERYTWQNYLNGASFTDMTEINRIAKRPVYLGAGGKIIQANTTNRSKQYEYGDKISNDIQLSTEYMSKLEFKLYDSLRKPGISVQRAGTDITVILVRDTIIEQNIADISADGDDTLRTITTILNDFPATFIEIAGYTDSMKNTDASNTLSWDMAKRVGVYFAKHDINTTRLFIVGRGSARPIASQDNIGRLTNRRIELKIVPAR